MHFFSFIIVFVAALVYACPPPFNNFDFLGNETHTTADLVKSALNQQGQGWVDAVDPWLKNPSVRWPQDSDSLFHTIEYCYANSESERNLVEVFNQGRWLWINQLGNPGRASGHSMRIKGRLFDDIEHYYCYQNGHPRAGQ